MIIRQLTLTNKRNAVYSLLPETGQYGVYFVSTSGYGYETNETTQQVGSQFIELEYNYKQHTISGTLVFYSEDPYQLYYDFVRFLSARPLTLTYTSLEDKSFNIDVYASKIEKSERSYPNALTASVTFSAYGLFYTESDPISSGASEESEDTSRIYKYPPGTVYFCDPTNMPLSFTDPCKYLESIINGYAQILYLEDDGVYLITNDSRSDVTVDEEGYILIEIDEENLREFSVDSDGYVLAEVSTDDTDSLLVECYPGTDVKIYESDTESPYVKSEIYMSNYHVLDGDVLTEDTGELYEIYQGEYSVLSNSTYISFTSDSEVESPCKLSIGSTSGNVVNPHWYHYLNGVLNGEGKYNGTIQQGNTLVIDTTTIPYSIKQFDGNGTEVVDCYESCDFSMERFVFIGYGVNTFSVSHENSTELSITLTPRVEYETV